ncbi:DUF4363 family protein [Tepidibacillus fermentans]|uniref:Uncharacterized protein DUF4363 n=1 Tax=Tepidibacillus fermentans TaxID=1281767 RepID=A0A4R3KH44_9BACI|nr:DUF4363 family protein [Tepidibacillus fermentans]TCS82590.1 uncharacterized protein DUF4363 [Tepidibacillus fermentans]
MRKKVIILGSTAIILLFIAIMVSGTFLKRPLTKDDNVIGQVNFIEASVKQKDWQLANEHLEQGIKAWEKVKNRIQFSVERDFITEIDNKLATLKGAIKAKDDKMIILTTEELKFVWQELGK